MTKVIIAQRITSVMHTDQIVILRTAGCMRWAPTRELPLAGDPIYQEIYASQMKAGDHGVPATGVLETWATWPHAAHLLSHLGRQ